MAGNKAYQKKNSLPLILTGGLVLIFLGVTVVAVLFFLSWARGMASDTGIIPGLNTSQESDSPYVERKPGQIIPTWVGEERITVLLLGIDERQQESGPFRTDTMMLLTLNPVTLEAGVLSIPRDLWVPIPGYNQARINTAHFLGDLYDYAGGGPALAAETVEYNLGVPINYYMRFNFQGFIQFINLIGGIDIYVEKTIHDNSYPTSDYGTEVLHIDPGQYHFDGEMALKYARTRHGSSDFERAQRQQQVMLAVLDRVTSLGLLPQLAPKFDEFVATLDQSIKTDLTLDEMIALAGLAVKVDRDTIRFGIIDSTCTQSYVTPEGAQVLVPIRDRMREVRDYVFGTTDVSGEGTTEQESATISVLNGTQQIGLASTVSQYLTAQGTSIAFFGNADRQDYATSLVIQNRSKPATAARLVTLLGLPQSAVINGVNATAEYDVVVILGADYNPAAVSQ
ncbi:MAG: LCP family protein [Anaerolineae bacterium]|jgi:LCP family protein required for cell wall assembly|nr:LCP family protein [Anaerolineae bacterium]